MESRRSALSVACSEIFRPSIRGRKFLLTFSNVCAIMSVRGWIRVRLTYSARKGVRGQYNTPQDLEGYFLCAFCALLFAYHLTICETETPCGRILFRIVYNPEIVNLIFYVDSALADFAAFCIKKAGQNCPASSPPNATKPLFFCCVNCVFYAFIPCSGIRYQ